MVHKTDENKCVRITLVARKWMNMWIVCCDTIIHIYLSPLKRQQIKLLAVLLSIRWNSEAFWSEQTNLRSKCENEKWKKKVQQWCKWTHHTTTTKKNKRFRYINMVSSIYSFTFFFIWYRSTLDGLNAWSTWQLNYIKRSYSGDIACKHHWRRRSFCSKKI